MAESKIPVEYNEDSIRSLDWKEHIRLRPGMYIGKLGDGSAPDDGIYVLMKEVIDNCIDEHTMGYGKQVEISIQGKQVTIRDYGRGIPLGKIVDVVSKINTGAKYDSKAFQKSVAWQAPQITKAGKAALSPGDLKLRIAIKYRDWQGQQTVFIEIQHGQKIILIACRGALAKPPRASCCVVVGQL